MEISDPKAIRALAHPVRLDLLELLAAGGPATAAHCGRMLGESQASCSFHLRQLAKYGLVEETGEGTGREKPWRATTTSTGWDSVQKTPEAAAAAGLLSEVLAESYFTQLRRWLEVRSGESEEWQRAAFVGDRFLWVTPEELAQVGRDLAAIVDQYFERQVRPELRPPGARLATYLHLGFPNVTLREEP
ncbi:MAG TPA: helix-turn-helix domain-containing protein [Streptosporangiaceae bacterium]